MKTTFDGKIVVITGASRGIGFSLACEAARRGAVVVAAARDAEALEGVKNSIAKSGGQITTMILDVTKKDSIHETIRAIVGRYGRIDVLINNAAVGLFEHVSD